MNDTITRSEFHASLRSLASAFLEVADRFDTARLAPPAPAKEPVMTGGFDAEKWAERTVQRDDGDLCIHHPTQERRFTRIQPLRPLTLTDERLGWIRENIASALRDAYATGRAAGGEVFTYPEQRPREGTESVLMWRGSAWYGFAPAYLKDGDPWMYQPPAPAMYQPPAPAAKGGA